MRDRDADARDGMSFMIRGTKVPMKRAHSHRRTTNDRTKCVAERETQTQIYRDEVLQQFGLVIVYKRLLRGPGCLVL